MLTIMKEPSRAKVWFLAARPKTLSASIAPVLIGGAIALADGRHHFGAFFAALICAILIQIGTNLANDYYDFFKGADNNRVGPTRMTQSGLVSPAQMKRAFLLVFFLAALLGTYLVWRGGWPILLIGISSLCFGLLYTAGPYPLAYLGFAEIFVLIFFGPVAVWGTYYVQALSSSKMAIVAGIAPGLISIALLSVNNLRDLPQDERVGKKTLAVRFGPKFAKVEYIGSVLVALLVPLFLFRMSHQNLFILAATGTLIFVLPSMKTLCYTQGPSKLNNVLASTGKFLFLFGLTLSVGIIL